MAKIECDAFVAHIIRHDKKTIIRVRNDANTTYPYFDFVVHDWDQEDLAEFSNNQSVKIVLYTE